MCTVVSENKTICSQIEKNREFEIDKVISSLTSTAIKNQTTNSLTKFFEKFLFINKLPNHEFFCIHTNGYTVDIVYKKEISNQSNCNKKLINLDILDEKQNLLNTKAADFHKDIVGVDPGETDFVTIFSNGKVQNFNKMIDSRTCVNSVSTKQYYSRSGFNTKIAAIQKFNKSYTPININEINSATPPKNNGTFDGLLLYFDYINRNTESIMAYYKSSPIPKLAFNTHRKKLRFCMRLFNRHFKNKIIAFGNYRRGDDSIMIKKRPPIQWFKKFILRQGGILSEIDEYNTSKICSKCFNILHKYKPRTKEIVPITPGTSVQYSKLKACSTCKIDNLKSRDYGQQTIVHRDSNAAINICEKFKRALKSQPVIPEFDLKFWKNKTLQSKDL